jgi:lysyl-tRNA synthetase class 2
MRHEVQSSSIKAIEETGRGTMIVEFHNRGKYEYFDVPADVIRAFVEAPSVGRFFNENIRDEYRNEPRS